MTKHEIRLDGDYINTPNTTEENALEKPAMELYVRSRWQIDSAGRTGYFWRETEPQIATAIEANSEFVTDHSATMLAWFEYSGIARGKYYLYLTGVNSGYKDNYDRPINHTLIWEGDKSDQVLEQLRWLMIEFAEGSLEDKLRTMIKPNKEIGFSFKNQFNIPTLIQSKNATGVMNNKFKPFADKMEFARYLRKNRLTHITKGFRLKYRNGPFVIIGSGFSNFSELRNRYKLLRMVCNMSSERTELL